VQKHIKNFGLMAACAALSACLIVGCASAGSTISASSESCPHCAAGSDASVDKAPESAAAFVTEWLSPDRRPSPVSGFKFENQAGEKLSLSDLHGAPVAVSFIYTRCENQRKCPLVAQTMAELDALLRHEALSPAPRVALITYDPEYDTPAQLRKFAQLNGMKSTSKAVLLRPEQQAKERLFKDLSVRVNYNERGVNLHGIQLILLDKQGRYVRTYHTLLWDNDQVARDLARLAAE
jgi:cytochrome oxidase Cu insertion factor (SCO1/SenC/PrrC family)